MMGCLVPRRECPCQAERRAREEQTAFLKKDKEKEKEKEDEGAEKQEESKGSRFFGFGLLRNLQKSLFGSNLNLNSSKGHQPKGKRGSYRALAQEEPPGLASSPRVGKRVVSPGAARGLVQKPGVGQGGGCSDLEDFATSPGSMASSAISAGSMASSAISAGSRMSTTTGTESPVVLLTTRLPTTVSLRWEEKKYHHRWR